MEVGAALLEPTQRPAREVPSVAVEARDLAIVFDAAGQEVTALMGVDLTIGAGHFVSLIGPSGCGKTTLLRAIADLVQPSAGTLLVNGLTPREARKQRAYGYVFQAPALYPWRSVARNVMLPLEIMGLKRASTELQTCCLAEAVRKAAPQRVIGPYAKGCKLRLDTRARVRSGSAPPGKIRLSRSQSTSPLGGFS
jgi:ABC-type sugar transport system ATPase subunit